MPWLASTLADALRTQRGHALLIHGPQGAGQFELALQLAGAWLCEAAPQGEVRTAACGICAGCRLVAARSHPDLLVLVPEALREALGWDLPPGEADAVGEGGGRAKPSKEIKVAALRGAIAFAQTTASRGRGKVLVLYPAERINSVAANTLLKTLEEPPGSARFLLASAAVDALLPTIRSRCQAFLLHPPPPEAALTWLAEQGVSDPGVVLAAAGGQPRDALVRAGEGIDASSWRQLPHWLCSGQTQAIAAWPLPRLVDALQKLCHDMMCLAVGAAPRYFPADALPAPAALSRLVDWQRELQRAARQVEHPLGAALFVDVLVMRARQALDAKRAASPGMRLQSPSVHWAR